MFICFEAHCIHKIFVLCVWSGLHSENIHIVYRLWTLTSALFARGTVHGVELNTLTEAVAIGPGIAVVEMPLAWKRKVKKCNLLESDN